MASASARYSASVLDRATTVCFLLRQEMRETLSSGGTSVGRRRHYVVEATDALVIQLTRQSVLAVMLAKAGVSAYLLLDLNQ